LLNTVMLLDQSPCIDPTSRHSMICEKFLTLPPPKQGKGFFFKPRRGRMVTPSQLAATRTIDFSPPRGAVIWPDGAKRFPPLHLALGRFFFPRCRRLSRPQTLLEYIESAAISNLKVWYPPPLLPSPPPLLKLLALPPKDFFTRLEFAVFLECCRFASIFFPHRSMDAVAVFVATVLAFVKKFPNFPIGFGFSSSF